MPIGTLGKEPDMTTPNGTPSVAPSPRDLNEQMQAPGEASVQAHAKGGGQYTGSGEPAPELVGQFTEDVVGRYTEGATVGSDQTEEDVTAPQPAP